MREGTISRTVVGVIAFLVSMATVFAEDAMLAKDGKTDYRIVVPATAAPAERYAAEELQGFVKQSTGAELAIVDDATAPSDCEVILGTGTRFRQLAPDVVVDALGEEGYVIRTVGKKLLIGGAAPRGTLYGVYEFLENALGVRFFTPEVTKLPKHDKLALPQLDRRVRPVWEYREVYYAYMRDPVFAARLRLNGSSHVLTEKQGGGWKWEPFGHSFYTLVPPDTYGKEHPEYYALIDGKRDTGGQLCLTNPDVAQVAAENALKYLREHPGINILSVSQMDWNKFCQCERCRKFNLLERRATSYPDHCEIPAVILLCNEIGERIEKEFPEVMINTLAYCGTWCAPATLKCRRNVSVHYAPIGLCYSHPIEADPGHNDWIHSQLDEWLDSRARVYIWDYVVTFSHFLVPHPNWDVLKPNLITYRKHGATGYFGQAAYVKGDMAEARGYVLAKLLWDDSLETDALIAEFLEGFYGPAAPPIAEYIAMMRRSVNNPAVHLHLGGDPLMRPVTTLELYRMFPNAPEKSAAYAYASFDAEAGTAPMAVNAGDARVWLNGKEVYSFNSKKDNAAPKPADVQLVAGRNQILVQTVCGGPGRTISIDVKGRPMILDWLVLGPIAPRKADDPLADQPLGNPATVKPKAGQKVKSVGAEWREWSIPKGPHYLSDEMLADSQKLFDKAKALAKDDKDLLLRVRAAELPIRYCMIWRMTPEQRRQSPLVEEFIQMCEAYGITDKGEMHKWRSGSKDLREDITKAWGLKPVEVKK